MKIVFLALQFGKNAFWKHFDRALSLSRRGHETTVISTHDENHFRTETRIINGVKVIMVPDLLWGFVRQGIGPVNALRRSLLLLRMDFDIAHAIDSRPGTIVPALAAKYLKGKKIFVEWTDLFGRGGIMAERSSKLYQQTVGHIESFLEEKPRPLADGSIAISMKLRGILHSMNIPEERTLLLPLASDLARAVRYDKESLRLKHGLEQDAIYLAYVGNIYPRDADLLVGALRLVRKRSAKDVRLILIGRHKWVEPGTASELGILTTGFVSDDDLFSYLGASDIHLLPLKCSVANEARFPCKVNDYFLVRRPLVSTPVSDIPYYHEQYNFGRIASDDSVDCYAEEILKLLDEEDKWEEYGNEAVRCARECFATEVIAERLEDFYLKISSGGARYGRHEAA